MSSKHSLGARIAIIVMVFAMIGGWWAFEVTIRKTSQPQTKADRPGATNSAAPIFRQPSNIALRASSTASVSSSDRRVQSSDPFEITLQSVVPDRGPVGTMVTVYGSGFSESMDGNVLSFRSTDFTSLVRYAELQSNDGETLTFVVPNRISDPAAACLPAQGSTSTDCSVPVTPGTYMISVQGTFSNEVSLPASFVVTTST